MANIHNRNEELCTGCGACFSKCAKGAIAIVENKEGFFAPLVDAERCIDCGECIDVCPQINGVKAHRSKSSYLVRSQDAVRALSTSGGAFALLAEAVMERGGVVCGASYTPDYKGVYQSFARSKSELASLTGHKDVCSFVGDTYKETREYLESGIEVLYAGTPCQIAGLCSYLGKLYENLYTVDMACHGQCSATAHRVFLSEYAEGKVISEYRAQYKLPCDSAYAPFVRFSDGTEKRSYAGDSRWFDGTNGIINRECCYSCKYASLHRVSDITLADASSLKESYFVIRDRIGASLVMVNNKKGARMLSDIRSRTSVCKRLYFEELRYHEPQLGEPIERHAHRDFFFSHLESEGYNKALLYGSGKRFDVGIVGDWLSADPGVTVAYGALASVLCDMGKSSVFIRPPYLGGASPNERSEQAASFFSKHFKVADYCNLKDISNTNSFCDSFMVGRDTLWTLQNVERVGYTFFLDFVKPDKKKIAFPVSLKGHGLEEGSLIHKTASDFLGQLDGIGVPCEDDVELCNSFFGAEAERVLDPILICSSRRYSEMAGKVNISVPRKYMLCYMVNPTSEKEAAARLIAKRSGLSIVSLAFSENVQISQRWRVGTVIPHPVAEELLQYIGKCSYLFTDSYHGACLGIAHGLPLAVMTQDGDDSARVESVFALLGVDGRIVHSLKETEENKKIHLPIDYGRINENIEKEKRRAQQWLDDVFAKDKVPVEETQYTKKARLDVVKLDVTGKELWNIKK